MYTKWLSMVNKIKILVKNLTEIDKAKNDYWNELARVNAELMSQQKMLDHTVKELTKSNKAIKQLTI